MKLQKISTKGFVYFRVVQLENVREIFALNKFRPAIELVWYHGILKQFFTSVSMKSGHYACNGRIALFTDIDS